MNRGDKKERKERDRSMKSGKRDTGKCERKGDGKIRKKRNTKRKEKWNENTKAAKLGMKRHGKEERQVLEWQEGGKRN